VLGREAHVSFSTPKFVLFPENAVLGCFFDILVDPVQQHLDDDAHAANARQIGVVAGIGGGGEVMKQRRVQVGSLAAEDADLGLGERVELRRQRGPDPSHTDLFVGHSAGRV
jgi:hypothetical protein